jgi:hypothetical protein
MQRCRLMIACIFILFHDKVAIQWKNNLLITHIIFFSIGQSFIVCKLTWLASLGNIIYSYKISYHSTGVEILIPTA